LSPGFNKNAGWILVLILWAVFQTVQLDNEWDRMDGDDAQYILHARSLLVNHLYNDPNLIYRPGAITTAESVPPGWPVLLLPVVALFGVKLFALKAYVILFALLSGLVLYRILLLLTRDSMISLLITGKYYFSMTTIVYSRVIYSEWPYLLATLAAIWMVLRHDFEQKPSPGRWALIGAVTGAALLCRSVGLSLVIAAAAVLIQQAVRHRRMFRSVLLSTCLFAAGFLAVTGPSHFLVKAEKGPGYKSQILLRDIDFHEKGPATPGEILARIPRNGASFVKSQWPLLFGRIWHEYAEYQDPALAGIIKVFLYAAGALILILTGLGFWSACKKGPSIVEYYTMLYLAVMSVIWFHYEPYRYLMPIAPFLMLYLVQGLQFLFNRSVRIRKRLVTGFLWVLLAVNVFHAGLEVYKYKYSNRNAIGLFRPYKATVLWLKKYVMPDEILVADEPRWYALETGLKVTTFLKSRDPEKVMKDIEQLPNAIIVFDPSRRFQKLCLVPVFQKHENRFRLVQEFGHIRIFELRKTKDN
jgi:hypothetical protein